MRILIFGRPAVAPALVALTEQAKAAGALTVTWADPKFFSSNPAQLRLDVDAVVVDGHHSRHPEIAAAYLAESKVDATEHAPRSKFFGKRVIVVPPDPCEGDLRNVIALLGLAQEVPVVNDDDEEEDETEKAPAPETPVSEKPETEKEPATTPANPPKKEAIAIESLGYPELKALAREKGVPNIKGNTPKVDIVAALHALGIVSVER